MCDSPQLIAHLTVPYGVKGLEQGAPVALCRLEGPISGYWDAFATSPDPGWATGM